MSPKSIYLVSFDTVGVFESQSAYVELAGTCMFSMVKISALSIRVTVAAEKIFCVFAGFDEVNPPLMSSDFIRTYTSIIIWELPNFINI